MPGFWKYLLPVALFCMSFLVKSNQQYIDTLLGPKIAVILKESGEKKWGKRKWLGNKLLAAGRWLTNSSGTLSNCFKIRFSKLIWIKCSTLNDGMFTVIPTEQEGQMLVRSSRPVSKKHQLRLASLNQRQNATMMTGFQCLAWISFGDIDI